MRLCIDYRQLNARTKSDAFPTGNVLDVIDNMAGARYFSTIDLAQGYHQVPVAEADREKTAFRTSSGLWEFTRMPFGLKGAPATFCRLMARALGHMSPTQLALYMDDICVISATFDSHLERLEATFKNLLVHGLRIKAHKCSFAMAEVIFCGHKLSAETRSHAVHLQAHHLPALIRRKRTRANRSGRLRTKRHHLPMTNNNCANDAMRIAHDASPECQYVSTIIS